MYWSTLTAVWLFAAAVEYHVWGYRSDFGSVWAAVNAVLFLGAAGWTTRLIVDVGPVRIRDGRLEFRERLRRHSLHPTDIKSWKWTRYQQTRFNARSYLTLTLTGGRTISLRHRYLHSGTPTRRHAAAALTAFLAPEPSDVRDGAE